MSGMELDEEAKEEEEERSVTCRDIKLIMPTVLILLFTLFVMVQLCPDSIDDYKGQRSR